MRIKHERLINIVGEFAKEVDNVQCIKQPVFVYVWTDQLFSVMPSLSVSNCMRIFSFYFSS